MCFRRTTLQKATADFLAGLSVEQGTEDLYRAALLADDLAGEETDRALAGALKVMRWVLLGFARDLESDPAPETWSLRQAQLDALVLLVRHRDAASFATFATFPA